MKKAYGFVVLTAFLFGTMEVACKVAGNQLDPFQLTFIRFAIGGLIYHGIRSFLHVRKAEPT